MKELEDKRRVWQASLVAQTMRLQMKEHGNRINVTKIFWGGRFKRDFHYPAGAILSFYTNEHKGNGQGGFHKL
ncbi:hypothetical protein DRP07_11765 [Archaeoglobales archaeon]|nr:MAG: hypothetical protein DRP07_11765 [Archaeoglobales archaeon]